jgi:hypothetical protein
MSSIVDRHPTTIKRTIRPSNFAWLGPRRIFRRLVNGCRGTGHFERHVRFDHLRRRGSFWFFDGFGIGRFVDEPHTVPSQRASVTVRILRLHESVKDTQRVRHDRKMDRWLACLVAGVDATDDGAQSIDRWRSVERR